jgi:hypothetical protein
MCVAKLLTDLVHEHVDNGVNFHGVVVVLTCVHFSFKICFFPFPFQL